MRYSFWVITVPGFEAETTSSGKTRAVAREAKKWLKAQLADGAAGDEPVTYKPGDLVPLAVAAHVVAPS